MTSLTSLIYLFYNQKIIDPCGTYIQSQVNIIYPCGTYIQSQVNTGININVYIRV